MKSNHIRYAVLFILLASMPFYFGCESDVMVGSILTLTTPDADGYVIPNGKDYGIIEATVIDADGLPAPLFTEVKFTTSRGMFSNARQSYTVYTTTSLGTAKAYLFAPVGTPLGTAYVTATVNDDTARIEFIIGYSCVGSIAKVTATASPDTIPADGVTSSEISATVTDCDGDYVIGELLEFRTTKGLFSNGKMVIYRQTKESVTGSVSAFLIAKKGTPLGPVSIRITSTTNPQVFTIVTVKIGARPAGITLTAVPTSIAADGLEVSVITATVTDYQGTPVPPGTSVTFETLVGVFSNGGNSITVSTGTGGAAVAHFVASVGTPPQTAQITAVSMGVSARVVVTITAPTS